MTDFRADLHCHTTCSDGTMSPTEIVFHAKKIGLSGLSITDHDSILSYPEAIGAAKKANILLGSGVEFSSVDQGINVHILGYDIDLENPSLQDFCQRHIERRKNRNQRILEKLSSKGMILDSESFLKESEQGKPVGRPHIATALVEKGYVRTFQEAFDRFIGDGMPCYDPGLPMSTDETIEIIHKAQGKAFIAHPHLLKSSKHIFKLLEKSIDGIECYYAKSSSDQEKKWLKIAQENNLLISGGSDFHGSVKPQIPLGCSWVDKATFERIFEKKLW